MFWMSQWILKKQDERFLQALIETKAQVDEVSDRQVQRVLFLMRCRRAAAPYLYIFKLTWETICGRYRIAFAKVRGGADQTSGGSAGAAGQPVAQHTGFSGFTTGYAGGFTTASAGPSPGGLAGNINPSTQVPPPQVFEDAGIRAGEVIAYRCWRLRDGQLFSVFQSDVCWEPGKVMEGDAFSGDGVHAFKSILLMAEYGGYHGGENIVTGTVDMWGDVYEHERGYRASKAAVRSIDDSPYYDAKALRRMYGLNKRRKKPLTKPEA